MNNKRRKSTKTNWRKWQKLKHFLNFKGEHFWPKWLVLFVPHFLSTFLSILERSIFSGLKEKMLEPHKKILPLFSSYQALKTYFFFFLFSFLSSYFTSNQTQPKWRWTIAIKRWIDVLTLLLGWELVSLLFLVNFNFPPRF